MQAAGPQGLTGGITLPAQPAHTACPFPSLDVGGLLFDKDAVYIDIPDWKVGRLAGRPLGAVAVGC